LPPRTATHSPPSNSPHGDCSFQYFAHLSEICQPARRRAPQWIHLKFDIPRLSRPVDAMLATSTAVIPIQFKVGAKKFQ
jgi:hypothetical protein